MKIISYNVNGIRSAIKKGFLDWVKTKPADIICLQEVRAMKEDIDISSIEKLGYNFFLFSAEKKGYSGVAILSLMKPISIRTGVKEIDYSTNEGRIIIVEYEIFSLINTYFPSGTSGAIHQAKKMQFLGEYLIWMKQMTNEKKHIINVGDFNIAHKEIDIHNPISNKNSSGFLPEEREWITKYLTSRNFIDSFRYFYPQKKDEYSWWSHRANSRENNKGWRIDYIMISENLKKNIKDAFILQGIKHSDHCPVGIDIAF